MAYKISVALVLLLGTPSGAQVGHILSPLKPLPQKFGGFEVVSGDPDKAGVPFVVRIANDAGYVVPPHTHPEDENIVVVKGSWSVAMGNRVDRARLQPMDR